ncbi:NUDIX hydrolase [Nakamurella leprariae]|uniref:NUDIX hydrolase n=1 Tax=Nakamurella leprariae TaxID=2803911 RepID=A0A938YCF7_9ACTN|nr:NUDIX hydrolase [Nakamurella leprariae]MBM9467068.1 NUDIX hydrolase [Nakamurella leprariae]
MTAPDPTADQAETSYVSVDVLALRFDHDRRAVQLGIGIRATAPFAGRPALPGVLLRRGERLGEAGRRALGKIGVTDPTPAMGQLITFDEPNRDPRGPTLSVALWAVADSTGTADWVPLDTPPALAFDHARIVADCRDLLAGMLWRDLHFTRALTGPVFAAADALDVHASLTGRPADRGNLNRVLAGLPGLTKDGVQVARGRGRPSALWRWQDDAPDGTA